LFWDLEVGKIMEFASFHLQQHQLQEESAQFSIISTTPPPDSKPSTTITNQSWIPSNM